MKEMATPRGPIEKSRADRIALCIWQQDRAARLQVAAMNYNLQETLDADDESFTPAQRAERALIASVNNECLDPIHGYASPLVPAPSRITMSAPSLDNTNPG